MLPLEKTIDLKINIAQPLIKENPMTGITKEQYEQWCKESETYNLSADDLEKDLLRVKSRNQEEIIILR